MDTQRRSRRDTIRSEQIVGLRKTAEHYVENARRFKNGLAMSESTS